MHWILLFIAGLFEITWAVCLKFTNNFRKAGWSIVTIITYCLSIYFLSLAMKYLPLGTSYAIWTGMGALGTTAAGIVLFGESISLRRMISLLLIFTGIVSLKLFNAA